jgi:hypothetical protein
MVLQGMSWTELKREIERDHEKITGSSTLHRFIYEYHQEREKKKVKPASEHIVFRHFKTNSKNTWFAMIRKSPESEVFRGPDDIRLACFLYYRDHESFRVIFRSGGGILNVFNGHVFKRYRERMGLEIDDPKKVIEHYFERNPDMNFCAMPIRDGYQQVIGMIPDGFLLGEAVTLEAIFLNKTFISTQTANQFHQQMLLELEATLLTGMLREDGTLVEDMVSRAASYKMAGFSADISSTEMIRKRLKELRISDNIGPLIQI